MYMNKRRESTLKTGAFCRRKKVNLQVRKEDGFANITCSLQVPEWAGASPHPCRVDFAFENLNLRLKHRFATRSQFQRVIVFVISLEALFGASKNLRISPGLKC